MNRSSHRNFGFCLKAVLGRRGLAGALAISAATMISSAAVGRQAEPGGIPAAPYKVKVLPDVRVRMRDGVELAIRITRPDAEGKFPAVMACNPYRALMTMKAEFSEREYSYAPDAPAFLAQHGYVVVNYDIRGSGSSGGSSPDMYSDAERQDGYDMIEWIAAQPWCSGNVGMWGMSYGGVDTWQVASLAPPHLKAIIAGDGTEDVYGDWTYPGGLPRSVYIFGHYAASRAASNFCPPDPSSTGEKWAEIWEEHLKNDVPWSIAFLKHQAKDAYWLARSLRPDYSRIKCPVFVHAGWLGWYPTAMLRAFAQLNVPKRALIGPWLHTWPEEALPGPRVDGRPEYLRWFDQFLKGTDTGVLKEPPVTIFVDRYQPPAPMYREQPGFWRQEHEWPLARTQYTPMYLSSDGRLERRAGANQEPERDTYTYRPSASAMSGILAELWALPLDQRQDEAYALTYTTPPLATDLEVTGDPAADLFVSSSAEIAYYAVRVCDVAPDGTSKLVTDGGLNATHRTSDIRPEPLKPGEVYELKFKLKSLAYIFPVGHRIRVDISSADFQNSWPASKAALNTLVRGTHWPSRVILPVAPTQSPFLPKPDLRPSPNPLPDTLPKPDGSYTITYDRINQTTTVSRTGRDGGMSFTISDLDPAVAVMKSTVHYDIPGSTGDIKVEAHAVTMSDAKVFRHTVEIEVTVDGKPHFNRSWAISVPRVLN